MRYAAARFKRVDRDCAILVSVSHPDASIRGFQTTFTVVGAIYTLMACSYLVQGPTVLLEFDVSEQLVAEPVLRDFFYFFYQLMAYIGVLTIVVGHVARERTTQMFAAGAFTLANLFFMLRDLSTSDSSMGNSLYKGDKTLVFVAISLILVLIFGSFLVRGWRLRNQA